VSEGGGVIGGGHQRSLVEDELERHGWREPRLEGWRGRRGVKVTGSERGGVVGWGTGWRSLLGDGDRTSLPDGDARSYLRMVAACRPSW
jgi:hypothetical protein